VKKSAPAAKKAAPVLAAKKVPVAAGKGLLSKIPKAGKK
jgi:hypothetical protein